MTTLLIASTVALATNLPPITVEASRLEKNPVEIASHVDVMDSRSIAASNAKNVPELIQRFPGIFTTHKGGNNPALAEVTMRGYGENGFGRVAIVVDGEKINNPDMAAPNLARIPINGIEKIEILYGPQTVLHGDGASAGMINIVTSEHDYENKSYAEVHGGSWNSIGVSCGISGGLEQEMISYFTDFGYDHSDGYRANSGFDIYNIQGGIRKSFENDAFLRFSTFFSDAEYELPGPLSQYDYRHRPKHSTYDDWGRLTAHGINFSGKGIIADNHEFDFTLTFSQRNSHFTNGNYTDIYGTKNLFSRNYRSDIYSLRFTPQYTCQENIGEFENEFLFGTEIKYDRLDGKAIECYPAFDFTSRETYDIDRLTAGAFAHDEFMLTEKLSLILGSRLERAWNENNISVDGGRNDNFTAFETAVAYRPVDDAKLFLRWSKFYRNSFIDEYRWRNTKPSETSKPEHGWSAEMGGLWNMTEEWYVSGVGYYSEIDDEIHYNPFWMSNENSPWKHRRWGSDLAVGWERDKVAALRLLWSGVIATKAQGKYDGNWVPGVPRQQLNLEGRIWLWDEFSIVGSYRLIGARYAISDTPNANGRIGTISVFRIGCQYRPQWSWLNGWMLGFTCDNLFDKNYCDYAVGSVEKKVNSYYPAAGRSFMFTVRYEF